MKRVLAIVLAGGEGERLSILSALRAKPAVPCAGKYRIIDFRLFKGRGRARWRATGTVVPPAEAALPVSAAAGGRR